MKKTTLTLRKDEVIAAWLESEEATSIGHAEFLWEVLVECSVT